MNLTNAHKADLATFESKNNSYKSFMAEHAGKFTDAQLAGARQQRDELLAIKARIAGHVAESGLAADAAGFDSFLSDPGNGMKHLGSVADGHSNLGRDGRLDEVGAGLFSAKTWDAIKDPGYRKAFGEYLRTGERMSDGAYKTLEVGRDTQGGYLAPPEVLERVVSRRPTPTRLAGMVETITTGRNSVEMPKVNYADADNVYSTGFRATWTGEKPRFNGTNPPAAVADADLFGSVRIDTFTNMIEGTITNDMAEDGAVDVQGWMEGKFGETIDVLKDDTIANGSGINQPWGIVPYALSANAPDVLKIIESSAAAAGDIAADDIIDIACDVPEQYEDALRFFFNKTASFKYLRKLKDDNKRYLFGQGYQDSGLSPGKPTDLVGYPYTFTGVMRDRLTAGKFAAGATPIIFGDLKGYAQTVRLGFSVQVCKELLARQNQLLLIGRVRFGGLPLEPWRLRVLRAKQS